LFTIGGIGGVGAVGNGELSRVIVRTGSTGTGTPVVDFDAVICTQTGCTDAAGNVFTVGRSTSGRKLVVQSPAAQSARSTILFGTDDYATIPLAAIPPSNVSDSHSLMVSGRHWATAMNAAPYVAINNSSTVYHALIETLSSGTVDAFQRENANIAQGTVTGVGLATRNVVSVRVAGRNSTGFVHQGNGNTSTVIDNTAVGNTTQTIDARIGTYAHSLTTFIDAEIEAIAMWNSAISNTDHLKLFNVYAGGV
jgi:hypothetical protein